MRLYGMFFVESSKILYILQIKDFSCKKEPGKAENAFPRKFFRQIAIWFQYRLFIRLCCLSSLSISFSLGGSFSSRTP